MINRNDPDFRSKVLRMIHPESVLDYGQSVDVEAVRELCPDLYAIHIKPWLPEGIEQEQ